MTSTGFVLVGGNSSRMGRDKALLPWKERSLVEHIARCVSKAAGGVALIGAPDRYKTLNFPALADSHLDCGPLGGIEAALSSAYAAEYNLIVACDLPDLAVTSDLPLSLLAFAKRTDALCVAGREPGGRTHPLCAVYRAGALPIVRNHLSNGDLRLSHLLAGLNAETWSVSEALANVNSPEDWLAWQTK